MHDGIMKCLNIRFDFPTAKSDSVRTLTYGLLPFNTR